MRASVIITAQDEGKDLECTVANVWSSDPSPHEVIVVDDGSDPPIAKKRLASFDGVTLIRHTEPMGVDPARNTGASHATGDVLIFLDSHMRVPLDWLACVHKSTLSYPSSIFCSRSRDMIIGSGLHNGAEFDDIGHSGWIGLKWRDKQITQDCELIPAVLGACYIVPRYIWDELGGIHPCFRGWGASEQDLSLRTWLLGYEVRIIRQLVTPHRYYRKRHGNAVVKGVHHVANILHLIRCIHGQNLVDEIEPYVVELHGKEPYKVYNRRKKMSAKFADSMVFRRTLEQVHELTGYKFPSDYNEVVRKTKEYVAANHKS